MFQKYQVCGIFAFRSLSNIEHLLHHTRPAVQCSALIYTFTRIQTSQTYLHTIVQKPYPVISGQFRSTTDTNRRQVTPTDVLRHRKILFEDVWPFMLTSNGIWWCLVVSTSDSCCLEMWGGCMRSFSNSESEGIWVLFKGVCKVSVHLRVFVSV